MSARTAFLLLILSVATIDQTFSATNHLLPVYNEPQRLQRFNTLSQDGDHFHPDLLGDQLSAKSVSGESLEKSAEQKNEYNLGIPQHEQPSFKTVDHYDHVHEVSTEHQSQDHTETMKLNPENQTPESKESQETTTQLSPTPLNLVVPTVTTTEQLPSHTTQSTTASASAEETHAGVQDPSVATTTPVTLAAGHGHHSAACRLQGFSTTTIILIGVLAVTKVLWN